ncbi:MAG: C4-dicarboxylate ABC transporter substrate-binding protein, partial [Dysosmobacter sp.]|nr:C4-dicarboxylate ABC transporter substrate-binding protein [Dysosmobacter sp.]
MKKVFSVLLALVMVLSLAACGGNSGGQQSAPPSGGSDAAPADTGDVANDPKVTLVYAEVNPL